MLFDDNATGTTSVTVSTAVNPAVITFNNFSKAYSLAQRSVTQPDKWPNTASFTNGSPRLPGAVTLNTGVLDVNRTDNMAMTTTLSGSGTSRKSNTTLSQSAETDQHHHGGHQRRLVKLSS